MTVLRLAYTCAVAFVICAGDVTAFSPLQPLNGVAAQSLSFPSRTSTSIAALADDIQPGQIVEYRYSSSKGTASGSAFGLGAIVEPDGKRNWKILTSSGLSRSIPPKDIRHRVPKGRVSTTQSQAEADIASHEDAATEALAHDKASQGEDVVSVWEMLVEDGGESETDLETLAELIVGDASSRACYAARAVLTVGVESCCFKEGRGDNMYVPRPPDIVEALRSKARAEAEVEAKWEAIRERIQTACSGTSEAATAFCIDDETEEVRTAFEAIKRLGCLALLGPEELAEHEEMAAGTGEAEALTSARTFLKQISRKGTAEAARKLLVQTGVWHVHQNLDVLRQRIPMEFSPNLEQLAAELSASPPLDIDADKRLDLTHLQAFAIDEVSTREIDDALSVEILELPGVEGGPVHKRWRLWVHIADPTRSPCR
jgi:exoribonuclease-2